MPSQSRSSFAMNHYRKTRFSLFHPARCRDSSLRQNLTPHALRKRSPSFVSSAWRGERRADFSTPIFDGADMNTLTTISLIGPDHAGKIFSTAWQNALGGKITVTDKATGEGLFEAGPANAPDVAAPAQ